MQKFKLSTKCLKEPARIGAYERAETWRGKTPVPSHSTSPGLIRKVPPIHLDFCLFGWLFFVSRLIIEFPSESHMSVPLTPVETIHSSAYQNLPAEKVILPVGPHFSPAHCHAPT